MGGKIYPQKKADEDVHLLSQNFQIDVSIIQKRLQQVPSPYYRALLQNHFE